MWWLSYLFRMLRHRPSSLRMSATSCLSAAFSRSRKAARTEIWFSFSRRASRERFAASLFLQRRLQYLSSLKKRKKNILDIIYYMCRWGVFRCVTGICVFICNCLSLFSNFEWQSSEKPLRFDCTQSAAVVECPWYHFFVNFSNNYSFIA